MTSAPVAAPGEVWVVPAAPAPVTLAGVIVNRPRPSDRWVPAKRPRRSVRSA